MKENKTLTTLGTIAGSIVAILGLLWLLGEPFLEDYVDNHISTYDERKKEEDSQKVGLRHLLGDKMQVADDEVHIEIGKVYRHYSQEEKKLIKTLDSLCTEVKLNYKEIGVNIKAIDKLERDNQHFRKQLDKHGLFH